MDRKKIKMLKDTNGHDLCEKGTTLPAKRYHSGEIHEVHHALAKAFCDEMKVAEYVAEEKAQLKGAPENKARSKKE